ncbi:CDK5 regulatory subunit-associated protein 1 isoform X3 [Danio aesculapii]|uniref:CDK5 regulatory subunit-associated protein 1 isoform X3 n=1 Tax=Danio aesculapii TaxID=1142201 RepID=UPI0024BF778B|nr:CDK5 regulatory subunit-associated protein 1 isoform X3 [Danio aesculapii]
MNRSSTLKLFRCIFRKCLSLRIYRDICHQYYCTESSSPGTGLSRMMQLKSKLTFGPSFQDFIKSSDKSDFDGCEEYEEHIPKYKSAHSRKVYFETYGCQMNTNDTEIAWSILQKAGYSRTHELQKADVVLLVTCSIREKAEQTIWNRLKHLTASKKRIQKHKRSLTIGVLGCMAERLKSELLDQEKLVDVLAGPDAYRDLPRLLSLAHGGQRASNVLLSLEETYADVIPVHQSPDGHSAFVSIMRGCDNMCSYCIVPFTRGRERSRPMSSIVEEVRMLSDQGVKEITLLGQNVNSYRDLSKSQFFCFEGNTQLSRGFQSVYRTKQGGLRFADLLDRVSLINPNMRIRFTSPHPKDFPDEVLQLIQERRNICKHLHLPAQSGSSRVLHAMRRGYTREAYLELVENIRKIIPGVSLSSDFIAGFCSETEEDHQQTISLLKEVGYNIGFFFTYSMRKESKRSSEELCGRNDGNVKVIFS